MLPPLYPLRETHMVGPNTKEWVLGRERFPQLANSHFVWVGHSVIHQPYRMLRLSCVYAQVVACFGGSGKILIEGELQDWKAGQVMLCPRGALHAFEASNPDPWLLAWMFYDDTQEAPMINGDKSRLIDADGADFVSTLRMLTREAASEAEPAAIQALTGLLQIHTLRLCGSKRVDERLSRLWEHVEADLGRTWDNKQLSRHAAMSEEHLRRLCLRHYGRSPMKHLLQLRMHRACVNLRNSGCKIEAIAMQLGFASVYSFSTAFKRWAGVSPGQFRSGEQTPN